MKTAIVNIGAIVTGDWRDPTSDGDAIVMADGKIETVGTASADAVSACDVVIDADGATAVPGFIDSQVHNTFGDYTPRQKTVGFLDSYVHGGTTTGISANENIIIRTISSSTTSLTHSTSTDCHIRPTINVLCHSVIPNRHILISCR